MATRKIGSRNVLFDDGINHFSVDGASSAYTGIDAHVANKTSLGLKFAILIHSVLGQSYVFIEFLPQQLITNFTVTSLDSRYGVTLSATGLQWMTRLNQILFFVGIIGGIVALRFVMEKMGRRDTVMLITQMFTITGCLLMGLSKFMDMFELLLIGRLIFGFGYGLSSIPLFVSECAPDQYRGKSVVLSMVGVDLWYLMASIAAFPNILGSPDYWSVFCLIPIIPLMFYGTMAFYIPRSPKHLYITKNNIQEAKEALRFYHGKQAKIDDILCDYNNESSIIYSSPNRSMIGQMFHIRRLRFAFVLCLLLVLEQCYNGWLISDEYQIKLFTATGFSTWAVQLTQVIIYSVTLILNLIVGLFLVETFGRRVLMIIAGIVSTGGMSFIFAGLMTFHGKGLNMSSILGLIGIALIAIGTQVGMSTIPVLLMTELHPQATRSFIIAIFKLLKLIINAMLLIAFAPFSKTLGVYGLLAIILIEIAFTVAIANFLPETKGKTVDEIIDNLPMDFTWSGVAGLARGRSNTEGMPLLRDKHAPVTRQGTI